MIRTSLKFNLKAAKEMIEAYTGLEFEVKEVYWDFGAGIKHWTLISKGKNSYQLLYWDESQRARHGGLTIEDLEDIINRINRRGW